jgi:hypothetical protein
MYCAGHLLASLGLAGAIARRRGVSFAAMAALAMAANAIDIDHVWLHHLDDGTADSLRLHPAHVHFALLALGLLLAGLADRRRFDYWAGVAAALCLHMALDELAYAASYDLRFLAAADAALLIGVIAMGCVCRLGVRPGRLAIFTVLMAGVCSGAQALLHFVLGLRLEHDLVVALVPPALSLAAGALFWIVFRPARAPASATDSGPSFPESRP